MSGQDISIELVEVAKEVHLSAKSLEIPPGLTKVIEKHQNLHLHPQVHSHHHHHIYTCIYYMVRNYLKRFDIFQLMVVD